MSVGIEQIEYLSESLHWWQRISPRKVFPYCFNGPARWSIRHAAYCIIDSEKLQALLRSGRFYGQRLALLTLECQERYTLKNTRTFRTSND